MKNNTKNQKKTLRKKLITAVVFLLVVFGTYFVAWFQLYRTAKEYYKEATVSFNSRNYITALKGERVITENDQGYIFKPGFEQVVNIYKSKYSYPKPQLYYQAIEKIKTIIYSKMTPELGLEIYKKYFKIDNQYLGEILIESGNLYLKQGNKKAAVNAFTLATESFPLNDAIFKTAEQKLKSLKINNGEN